jgi:DNA primase catalytic core
MLISKSDIDDVKGRHELAAFVASSGVELKRKGRYYVGRCPFHSPDNTPSLVIDPQKQLWNCLGACSTNGNAGGGKGSSGGDLFAYGMKLWDVDFREVFKRLGGTVRDEIPPPRPHLVRAGPGSEPLRAASAPADMTPTSRAPRMELFSRIVDHMATELAQQRRAQEYLESRGLRTRALWRAFKLGYASGSVAELAGTEETSDVRRLLVELGILAKDGEGRVHERMKGRLVFPLVAFNQLPVGLYGRSIDESVDPRHMFLPGPRRGLFNWNAARRSKEILVVESVLDALSLVEAGVGNAIPIYGINGVTEDHKELVKRCGVSSVVVALDADETGRKATAQVLALFEKLGVKTRAIEWPEKDPNDLLVRLGPEKTREVVGKLLAPALARDVSANPNPSADSSATVTEAVNPPLLTADLAPGEEAAPPVVPVSARANTGESAVKEEKARPAALAEASPGEPRPQPSGLSREELLGEVLTLTSGDRLWRVVWSDAHSTSHLRATVRVRIGEAADAPSYLDSLDLVTARVRESFARKAAALTSLADPLPLQRSLEADLMRIAAIGEERRKAAETKDAFSISMSQPDRAKALELLRAKDLLSRIASDIEAAGYVGEETNKLIGYLVGISRKLDMPLSMVILSPSGSGKSGLADALEALTPEEDFFSLSSLTAQALFYMPKDKLVRKFVLIEERAGSIEADYSIRALQSKRKLTRAVPVKDPATGKIETKIFEILGPAAFLETTTESRINVENATRCFEIHLDESPEQTERIQRAQRRSKTFEGLKDRESRDEILRLHHDAQRLLKTVSVVIPFAESIEFPTAWLRTRRDNLRFLHLIEALAFLRQYQRPIVSRGTIKPLGKRLEELTDAELREAVVIATLDDYEAAYELAGGLLGETLLDLKKPERAFLEAIRNLVERQGTGGEPGDFSRREAREWTGLPHHRVRELFETLLELEYVEPSRASRGAGARYRLTPAARLAQSVVPGLLTPEGLKKKLEALRQQRQSETAEATRTGRRER